MGIEIAVGPVFQTLRRADVCAGLEALGARVVSAVGPQTDLLVLGGFGQTRRNKGQAKAERKNRRKAQDQGLPIWNEYAVAALLARTDGDLDAAALRQGARVDDLDRARALTLAWRRDVTGPDDLDPGFAQHILDAVRARFTVTPEDAPSPQPVSVADVFQPATLHALCSGDASGYQLAEVHLDGARFRRVLHLPAGNSVTLVFSAAGDLLYELVELSGDGDLESLTVCALMLDGQPGDSLGSLIERGVITSETYGWEDHLG